MSDQDTSRISRYLLGELPKEEMDALETRLLSESKLFDLAESVEDDVIDRYVRGEMSREEARRFERRLLPSERIQERVAFARALSFRKAAARRSSRPSRPANVVPLFRSPVRLAWAATLVAALVAGALALQVLKLQDRAESLEQGREEAAARVVELEEALESQPPRTPVEQEEARRAERLARLVEELSAMRQRVAELEARDRSERAEPTEQTPSIPTPQLKTASVFLSLATRSQGEDRVLRLNGADRAVLELDLSGAPVDGSTLTATVGREGVVIWSTDQVELEDIAGEAVATVTLPTDSLTRGRYEVRIVDQDERPVGIYQMTVER